MKSISLSLLKPCLSKKIPATAAINKQTSKMTREGMRKEFLNIINEMFVKIGTLWTANVLK
jgi:hypothetical protein